MNLKYILLVLGIMFLYLMIESLIKHATQFDDFSVFGKAVLVMFGIILVGTVVPYVVIAIISWIVRKFF